MLTVWKRELKQFFYRWNGYVFLALFVMMTGLFMLVYNFYYGYTGFEYPLNFLCVTVAALLPLLTAPLFREERKSGMERFVSMLPISDAALVWGKYLALLSLLAALSLGLCICPLLLSVYGEVNLAAAFGGIFAFFCIESVIVTAETLVALLLRHRISVWLVSYALLVALVGLGLLATLLPHTAEKILQYCSVFGAYTPFLFGLFDLRAIAFCMSATVILALLLSILARRAYRSSSMGADKEGAR